MDQTTRLPTLAFGGQCHCLELFPRLLSVKLQNEEAATFFPKGHSSCHSTPSFQLPFTCSASQNWKDVTHPIIYATSNPCVAHCATSTMICGHSKGIPPTWSSGGPYNA